jgi:RHS repeat-associated protein
MTLQEIATSSGGTVLQAYAYSFDSHGNILAVNDYCDAPAQPDQASVACCDPMSGSCSPKPLSATYQYDSLDRLTAMSSAATGTYPYNYDNAGNLINKENQAQQYGAGAGPHALTSSGGTTYAYDANGNATSVSDGTTFTWSPENMPVQVKSGGKTVDKSFVGEAVWKKVENGTTTYYLPAERVENGKLRKLYGSFGEKDPDDAGAIKLYHGDHLGSATLVTKGGTPIFRAAYYPYAEKVDGTERIANQSMPYSPSTNSPKLTFNFKEKDSIGFYDYGARIYNPRTGRFLSADTSAADGLNRYAYVRNNPLNHTDPTGHQSAFTTPMPGVVPVGISPDAWNRPPTATDAALAVGIVAAPAAIAAAPEAVAAAGTMGMGILLKAGQLLNGVSSAAPAAARGPSPSQQEIGAIHGAVNEAMEAGRTFSWWEPINKPALLHELRALGTKEALATAKLISTGRINVNIYNAASRAGQLTHLVGGTTYLNAPREITLYRMPWMAGGAPNWVGAADSAAHETMHALQVLRGIEGFTKADEFEAYQFGQAAVRGNQFASPADLMHFIFQMYPGLPEGNLPANLPGH